MCVIFVLFLRMKHFLFATETEINLGLFRLRCPCFRAMISILVGKGVDFD